MTGRIPRVDKAWLCVPDSASPISLAMMAHTPQDSNANTLHRTQRAISRGPQACSRSNLRMRESGLILFVLARPSMLQMRRRRRRGVCKHRRGKGAFYRERPPFLAGLLGFENDFQYVQRMFRRNHRTFAFAEAIDQVAQPVGPG